MNMAEMTKFNAKNLIN